MKKTGVGKVWMRMGDNDDYQDFDNMFDAGSRLGGMFSETSSDLDNKVPPIRRYGQYGVEVEPWYTSLNYVSLFWGDDDAQPIRETSEKDVSELRRGFRDGAYIPARKKPAPRSSSKKKTARKGNPAGFGGIR